MEAVALIPPRHAALCRILQSDMHVSWMGSAVWDEASFQFQRHGSFQAPLVVVLPESGGVGFNFLVPLLSGAEPSQLSSCLALGF